MTSADLAGSRLGNQSRLVRRACDARCVAFVFGCASLAVPLLLPAQATPPAPIPMTTVSGVVLGARDRSAVALAELRSVDGHTLTRTDQYGHFVVRRPAGDTIVIRALGFLPLRVAVRANLSISLVPLPTVLPTMTTTVGARELRSGETTVRQTVLTRADIDASAAIGANQLLRKIPGLQELSSPPSRTSISIRGLDASRVLVLIDGEPAGGALIENRDIGRLSTVAAERIEVSKGPSSVEFGSDALGGVINLVTAAPSKHFTSDGLFRGGGLGRRESTLGVSQTVGAFGYRVSGGWRQVDRVTGVDADADASTLERVYDFRSTARYALSPRFSLRADVQAARERQRWPVAGGYNGFIDNTSGQGFVEGQGHALGGSLRARAFVQEYLYKYRQSQHMLPIAGTGDSLEQREKLQRYLVAYNRASGRQSIDVGAQFSTRALVSPDKVDGGSANDEVTEFFARDAWTFGPVLANVGARYTSSSLWGDALNPSVGLAWQANSRVRLRGNIARGFRAPSFKEIRYTFSNTAAGYTIIGNANLQPETSWSNSIGVTWAPVSNLSFDVEGYRNNVDGLIDTRFQGTNAAGLMVYRNVNVSHAHTAGVESNVQYVRGPLDVRVGYDYLRARNDETGLSLDRRARHTARVQLSRSWGLLSGLITDLSARYTGTAPLVGSDIKNPTIIGEQGAFLSVDSQLRLNLSPLAELSAGVNNLLDERPALYTPAFQRQLYVGLHLRWSRD